MIYYSHYYSNDILWEILFCWHLMLYVMKLSERYGSDLDDMSQVSFMCSLNTGGVLTWNLGSSKLSCASTGITRKGARQGAGVSSHGACFTSVVFLILFLSLWLVWAPRRIKIVMLPVFSCLCFAERLFLSTLFRAPLLRFFRFRELIAVKFFRTKFRLWA